MAEMVMRAEAMAMEVAVVAVTREAAMETAMRAATEATARGEAAEKAVAVRDEAAGKAAAVTVAIAMATTVAEQAEAATVTMVREAAKLRVGKYSLQLSRKPFTYPELRGLHPVHASPRRDSGRLGASCSRLARAASAVWILHCQRYLNPPCREARVARRAHDAPRAAHQS